MQKTADTGLFCRTGRVAFTRHRVEEQGNRHRSPTLWTGCSECWTELCYRPTAWRSEGQLSKMKHSSHGGETPDCQPLLMTSNGAWRLVATHRACRQQQHGATPWESAEAEGTAATAGVRSWRGAHVRKGCPAADAPAHPERWITPPMRAQKGAQLASAGWSAHTAGQPATLMAADRGPCSHRKALGRTLR
ncbi:MAG: hypothetical protein QOE61_2017 [Micromonosporaceae bacterium]|nr:hypothetical protein [Micromonosporaceae bacterium]